MTESCGNCRFLRNVVNGQGDCRRRAPAPGRHNEDPGISGTWATYPRWPQMRAEGWCGEWESLALRKATEDVLAEAAADGDEAAAKALRDWLREKAGR